jgi:hypothetical protein
MRLALLLHQMKTGVPVSQQMNKARPRSFSGHRTGRRGRRRPRRRPRARQAPRRAAHPPPAPPVHHPAAPPDPRRHVDSLWGGHHIAALVLRAHVFQHGDRGGGGAAAARVGPGGGAWRGGGWSGAGRSPLGRRWGWPGIVVATDPAAGAHILKPRYHQHPHRTRQAVANMALTDEQVGLGEGGGVGAWAGSVHRRRGRARCKWVNLTRVSPPHNLSLTGAPATVPLPAAPGRPPRSCRLRGGGRSPPPACARSGRSSPRAHCRSRATWRCRCGPGRWGQARGCSSGGGAPARPEVLY